MARDPQPQDPDYEARVRESFARQAVMGTIGATLAAVGSGAVDVRLPFRAELAQQHGLLHAGIVGTIADSAAGYAALTLMPPGAGVLSIEYKLNLMSPAAGDAFVARGRVARAGRTITVCTAEVVALREGGEEKVVALFQGTMMTIVDRDGVAG